MKYGAGIRKGSTFELVDKVDSPAKVEPVLISG